MVIIYWNNVILGDLVQILPNVDRALIINMFLNEDPI